MEMKEKNNNNYHGIWKKFISMLYHSKLPYGWMAASLALALVARYFSLKQPEYLAGIIDGNYEMSFVMTMVGITTVQCLTTMVSNYIKNIAIARVDRNMQRTTVRKIMSLPVSKLEEGNPRELISRVTTDTTQVSTLMLNLVVAEIPRLYYMLTAVYTLYVGYNQKLALSTLFTIPVTIAGSFIAGKLVFGKADQVQTQISVLTGSLAEKVYNLPIIKSYNQENNESESGNKLLDKLVTIKRKKAWAEQINTTMASIVSFLPQLFIVIVGARLILKGEITVGIFIAFYQFATTFCTYVTEHMTLWAQVKTAQGATYRLANIMELEEEKKDGSETTVSGNIVFENVSFEYGDKKVLDNVSFTVKMGEQTALVGYSGCGKTTTLNLIEQFYRPSSGTIKIGGKDIQDWSIHSYRNAFTYLSQNAPAVSGTIRQAVTYGMKQSFTDEEIYAALEKACAAEFVEKLGGLDYQVGTSAEKLSGGQRQKLSLARAFLSQTEYMLLDEATSALDTMSTIKVQKEINRKMAGKTVLMVAHNVKTITDADKIIVFNEGRILAEGTHLELMNSCSFYRELVNSQTEEVQTA